MTTGKSITDHRVSEAATWLASVPSDKRPRPIVPELRRRFALTPVDACRAIAEASRRQGLSAEAGGS